MFSHDFKVAMLVNGVILVSQITPVGVEFFSYVKLNFLLLQYICIAASRVSKNTPYGTECLARQNAKRDRQAQSKIKTTLRIKT